MTQIREALQGYKTYMIATIAVLTAILAWSVGEASPFESIEAILIATGLGTLRAGVATEAQR